MRILYATSSLPYGAGEAFVIPEVAALGRRGHELTIVPVHGRGPVLHEDARDLLDSCLERSLLSVAIIRGAARQLARRPGRSLRAFRLLLGSRSPRILLKNLAVLPKGLWLGLEAERRGIDHIHAHWGATSSTLALIASRLSGIPWSVTVHRWDLDENNLLAAKVRRAAFVRAINEIGLRKLAAATGGVTGDAFVLHMGVDVPAGIAPPAAGGRVLAAASLREVKGHVYLFEAARLLRERGVEVRIECVGDGPLRPELERYVAEHGLGDHVVLTPALSHRVLLDRLAAGAWCAAALVERRDAVRRARGDPRQPARGDERRRAGDRHRDGRGPGPARRRRRPARPGTRRCGARRCARARPHRRRAEGRAGRRRAAARRGALRRRRRRGRARAAFAAAAGVAA